jgi:hypothetical protein
MITFPTGFVLPSSVEKQIKLAIHSSQMAFIVISPQEKADKKVAAQRARPASLAEHFEMFHISLGMKKPRGLRPGVCCLVQTHSLLAVRSGPKHVLSVLSHKVNIVRPAVTEKSCHLCHRVVILLE